MSSQDANINLSVDDIANKGLLKMQHNNGSVSLSFFKSIEMDQKPTGRVPKRYAVTPACTYQLSDFTKLEMDPSDPLTLTLKGPSKTFKLFFERDLGVIGFFDYINLKAQVKQSDCNPSVFIFRSLNDNIQATQPFMATQLPVIDDVNVTQGRITLPLLKMMVPTLNYSFEEAENPRVISKSDFDSFFDSEGRILENSSFPSVFYNAQLDPLITGDVLKYVVTQADAHLTREERLMNDQKSLEIYRKVKFQWQSTSKKQWDNSTDLKNLVTLIEADIKKMEELFNRFEHKKNVQKMVFNILLTLSIFSWDQLFYTQGFLSFVFPFIIAFIKDADGTTATKCSGEVVETELLESEVFWCFYSFYDSNKLYDLILPSKSTATKQILISVGSLLQNSYSPLLEMLIQKHVSSLDFFRNDLNTWFKDYFSSDDLLHLWISILTFPSTFQFFQLFVSAILLYLSPHFFEINPSNRKEFISRFDELKYSMKLNILLDNTDKLMQDLRSKKIE